MNDSVLFLRNVLFSAPLIIGLVWTGIYALRFNRFLHEEYTPLMLRMENQQNQHPNTITIQQHMVIIAACMGIIFVLKADFIDRNIAGYLFISILIALVLWELLTIPNRLRRSRQWFNTLQPSDQTIYHKYKKYRRRSILLGVGFVLCALATLRFLP